MSSGGGGGQFPQYQPMNSYGRFGGGGYGGYGGQSYAPDPRMAQFQPMRVQESGAMPSQSGMNSDAMMRQRFMSQSAPQMSGPSNPMVGSQMQLPNERPHMSAPPMSAPNVQTQHPMSAPMQQQRPQQSFEQFAQTLGNNGMTSGQMQDAYQKSISSQSSPNFWANTGVGTQKPPGFSTPPQWGNQTYGFDPRSMAGKTVGQDMAWYYGQDSVGRNINNAGDAVANGRVPADGFQRRAPWQL